MSVKAGDIVVRLDDTVTKAGLAIVTKTLNGLWARAARLEAEQRGLDKITFPPMLLDRADDPDVQNVMASESKLFEVRTTGRAGQKAQLRERVAQLNEEIAGLTAQETGQGQGNRAGRKGTGRRSLALRAAPGADLAPDRAGARRRPAVRRAGAVHRRRGRRPRARSPKPSCRSSRSTRTWSAKSPRICARPTTRSANSSSAR